MEISRTESSFPGLEHDQLDPFESRSGGIGDASAKRGRLRLREHHSSRNQKRRIDLTSEAQAYHSPAATAIQLPYGPESSSKGLPENTMTKTRQNAAVLALTSDPEASQAE